MNSYSIPDRTPRSIGTKTRDLFAYRCIRENIEATGVTQSEQLWIYRGLLLLQQEIYLLDRYGETNWTIEPRRLQFLWERLSDRLEYFRPERHHARELLRDISMYQAIELRMRLGELPIRVPLHKFYSLKICDVRLCRRLIASFARRTISPQISRLWYLFDLLTEIADDIHDVQEDSVSFNCNRFMFEAVLSGQAMAYLSYARLISAIRDEAVGLLHGSGQNGQLATEMYGWVVATADEVVADLTTACEASYGSDAITSRANSLTYSSHVRRTLKSSSQR